MTLYSIPGLLCPFTSIVSPHEDLIETHTLKWLIDFNLVTNEDQLEHYRNQRFAAMISRSYPYSDLTDLFYWCDLNTLLFIVDDQLDEHNIVHDKEELFTFITELISVLENERQYVKGKDNPIFCALSDFWQSMKNRSSITWQKKFIQGMKNVFFIGGVWAFNHISNHIKPSLDEYLLLRPYLGAANLATGSLEVTGSIELPEEIYTHPVIQRLTVLCENTICWSNDLFSLSKEMVHNADFNLVSVLSNHYEISIEEAILKAADIHDAQVQEFIRLSKHITYFDPELIASVQKYISALECLMRGNIEWSTQATTRYPHIYCGNAAAKNTYI